MRNAATVAAVMTGGLPLAVLAGALVLWNHFSHAPDGAGGALDRVNEPTASVREADSEPAVDSEPAPSATQPAPTLSLVRTSSDPVVVERDTRELLDEASLLSSLHELAAADPPQSLRLARRAVNRFPDSPHAPEFQWNVVKALFNMGRLDEAKNEARAMLGKYPNSSFTGDVIHHLLNPPPNPREP